MKTSQTSKEFLAVVQQLQRDNPQASYHDCYMRAKNFVAPKLFEAANEATLEQRKAAKQKALDKMGELANAEVKRSGVNYGVAVQMIAKQRPDLAAAISAVNEMQDLEITPDGEHLLKGFPPTAEVCLAMRIPIRCTKQQYAIAKLAEATKPTPEIAACIIMGIIRFCQTERGAPFSEIFESLKKHSPNTFAALRKVS